MYLRNMGVKASMSIAIVSKGELWGLFAFHSYTKAGRPVMDHRIICDAIGRTVSNAIESSVDRESNYRMLQMTDLLARVSPIESIFSFTHESYTDILLITDTDAMCLSIDGKVFQYGDKTLFPGKEFWQKGYSSDLSATNSVKTTGVIHGLVRFDLHRYKCAFFRKARSLDLSWGGDPDEAKDPLNPLCPRKSFESFRESARFESREWSKQDLLVLRWLKDRFNSIIAKENINSLQEERADDKIFFASMSHELRTPFHGVMGCIKIIEENLAEATETVRVAQMSGETMIGVLNDILKSSKNSHNSANGKSVTTLDSLVDRAVSSMVAFAATNDVTVEKKVSHDTREISINTSRVQHVLTNFLNNAIKSTEVDGSVVVHAGFADAETLAKMWTTTSYASTIYVDEDVTSVMKPLHPASSWVYFHIEDNGCGMDEHELLRVFNPYEQGDSSSKKYQGTGLGLYICASDVSEMRGMISCSSTRGSGTVMRFATPLETLGPSSRNVSVVEITKTPISTSTDTILLVDDSKLNIKLLLKTVTQILPKSTVLTCNSGKEALELCETMEPRLMITDYHMPDMNGDELTKRIKMRYPKMKVVAFTADMSEGSLKALNEVDTVLSKPTSKGDMERVLSEYM